jgi:hypothetical protein
MVNEEYVNLIHSEIDGTISERDRTRLHDYIETNPTARSEYEDLHKLALLMKSVPEVDPPRSLKVAVLNEINSHLSSFPNHLEVRMSNPIKSFFTSSHMSTFERLLILGGALASIAVLIYVSAIYPPPSSDLVGGTIGGAKKYHSEQITQNDVQLNSTTNAPATSDENSTADMFDRTSVAGKTDIVNRMAINDRTAWFSRLSVADKSAILAKTSVEERTAAFARMSVEERAAVLAALPVADRAAMYERIMGKVSMADKTPIAERAAMFDRMSVTERVSAFDRLPVVDRIQALDRLPVAERVSVFDRLSVAEKMQSLDRLPAAEKTAMFDRLSVAEKSAMYNNREN